MNLSRILRCKCVLFPASSSCLPSPSTSVVVSNGIVDVGTVNDVPSALGRRLKSAVRECIFASDMYRQPSADALKRTMTTVKRCKESDEVTSRTAAFGVAAALKLNRLHDAEVMLPSTAHSPCVVSSSLTVMLRAKQGRLDEAIDVVEAVLDEEELHWGTANVALIDEALDELYRAIKAKEEEGSQKQMARFRTLQRALTQYGRRMKTPMSDLLRTPLSVPMRANEEKESGVGEVLTQKVIDQVPEFMTKE